MRRTLEVLCVWMVSHVGAVLWMGPSTSWAWEFDRSVPEPLRQQVRQDLEVVQSWMGTTVTQLHHEIFGPMQGLQYESWLNSRVRYFGVSRCGGSAAVACVQSKYPNKIFVTRNFIQADVPQVGRISTIFHEARHTEFEQGMWPHARCPAQFPHRSRYTGRRLANKRACDSSPLGSYATAAVLMFNISQYCITCNEKTRQDAALYGTDQKNRVIGVAGSVIAADELTQVSSP